MEELILRAPTQGDEAAVLDYREAFVRSGDSMDGTAGLAGAADYGAWLAAVEDNARPETVRPGLVDATTLLALRATDGALVGMIDLRHRLNDHLLAFGGHIGYSVHPSARRQGYAAEMLRQALVLCRGMGLDRVLLTCDSENEASRRTIVSGGGVLENEVPEEGRITQRYWIVL